MLITLFISINKKTFSGLKSYSMKEYEDKAVSLALNRPKLQALTNKLKAVRLTCPLFDTTRWVRFIECYIPPKKLIFLYDKWNLKAVRLFCR